MTGVAGRPDADPTRGRWLLAGAAVLVQLGLGAVYAWSVFVNPFMEQMGWTRTQTTLPFTVAIGTIFIGAMIGGRIQDRIGPRPVVLAGGVLYSIGVMLSSLVESPDQLWVLILTYGVMCGVGLGAAYIVPIAMLVKWFPDRRGLITGVAVAGFGAGALITAPVANRLIDPTDVSSVFLGLGIAYLVTSLVGGVLFRNPPEGYAVPGFGAAAVRASATTESYTVGEALRSPAWYRLAAILALNVTAGIAFVSQAAPAAIAIAGMSATSAAGLVGILGIFNGAGRVLWGGASDRLGRMRTFTVMFAVQVGCFALLPAASSSALFFVLAALIYLCYGGGFGTMPAAAADFFGPRNAGAIYGAMIVAWSIGGIVGPLAMAALVDSTGGFGLPLRIIAAVTALSLLLPITTKRPAR